MAEPIVIHAETCNGDTYEIRYYRASDYDALAAENAALRSTIDDLTAGEIHTCHDHCQRTACILRRENTALRSRLSDIESQNRMMWDVANDREARLAEATELLARAEDDLSEWERNIGDDPQTTRLRLEITGFMAADSANERRCECGERLSGHEDESSTKCRWCVTGWKPSKDDQADSASGEGEK